MVSLRISAKVYHHLCPYIIYFARLKDAESSPVHQPYWNGCLSGLFRSPVLLLRLPAIVGGESYNQYPRRLVCFLSSSRSYLSGIIPARTNVKRSHLIYDTATLYEHSPLPNVDSLFSLIVGYQNLRIVFYRTPCHQAVLSPVPSASSLVQ